MKNRIKAIVSISLAVILSVGAIVTSLAASSRVFQRNISVKNSIKTADISAYLWESNLDSKEFSIIDPSIDYNRLKDEINYVKGLSNDKKCDYIVFEHSKTADYSLGLITYNLNDYIVPNTNINTDLTVSFPKTSEKMYAYLSFYFADSVTTEMLHDYAETIEDVDYYKYDFNNLDANGNRILPQIYEDLIIPNISSNWTLLETKPFNEVVTGDGFIDEDGYVYYDSIYEPYKRTAKGTKYTYYIEMDPQNVSGNDKYVHIPVFTNNQLIVSPNTFTEEYFATHLDHLYFNVTLETAYYNFFPGNPQQAYDEWARVVDPAFTNWKYQFIDD